MSEAKVYDLWSGAKAKGLANPPGMRWQVRWDERDAVTGKMRRPGRKFSTEAKANIYAKSVNFKLDAGTRAPTRTARARSAISPRTGSAAAET